MNVLRVALAILVLGFAWIPPACAQELIEWTTLEEAQLRAKTEERIVFVFVEAEWCGICKRMRRDVFSDAHLSSVVNENFIPVAIDLGSDRATRFNGAAHTERSFARSMAVRATPTLLFIDRDGGVLGSTSGYFNPVRFQGLLEYVRSDDFTSVSFEQFMARRDSAARTRPNSG